jgi:hypothetical protein
MIVRTILFTRAEHGLVAIECTLRRQYPRARLIRIRYSPAHAKVTVLLPCNSSAQ